MYADTCYMIYMFIRGHLALITDDPLHAETLAMHPKCKHMTDLCSLDGVDYMIKDWTWLMLSRFASCGLETMPRGSGKLLNLSLSRIWLQFWKLRWTPLRSLGTGTEKFFFHKWPYKYTNIIHMYILCATDFEIQFRLNCLFLHYDTIVGEWFQKSHPTSISRLFLCLCHYTVLRSEHVWTCKGR